MSTTDAVQAVRLLTEKDIEKQRTIHAAFLDLEKAFKKVSHKAHGVALSAHSVPLNGSR